MKNKFVVIDLETTGHLSDEGDRIIEVGIVVIQNEKIHTTYSTLVNPQKPIPTFISNLTGITDEDVTEAPTFDIVVDEIIHLFEDAYFIAHNVPFDLRFLNDEIKALNKKPLKNPILDTVELSRILYPQAEGYKLNQLASYLHIKHDEPHRALSDAYVTAKLFIKLKEKLEQLPYETIEQLLRLSENFHSNVSNLLVDQLKNRSFSSTQQANIVTLNGLAFRSHSMNDQNNEPYSESFGHLLDSVYESNGTMENTLTNYEKRQGQRDISETIFDSFQENKHALIEAGTGIGKSIAYLIPALYYAMINDERIVISTYTTQLQAQLLYEEIPLVKELLPFSVNVALLKGKHHYISLERFAWELANNTEHNYDIALTKAMILIWLTETETGDIDEIQLPQSGYFFFNQVCTKSEGTLDPTSVWFHHSFYQRAKMRARQAHLIITNHALLCTDLFNDFQFIPGYQLAVIDEAHHFEQAASRQSALVLDHITLQYTLNQIGTTNDHKWISKIYSTFPNIQQSLQKERWNQQLEQAKYDIDCLFEAISTYVMKKRSGDKGTSDIGRIQYRLDDQDNQNSVWSDIKEMADRVNFCLRELINTLQFIDIAIENEGTDANHYKEDLNNFIDLLQKFIEQIHHFFIDNETALNVKWIEVEGDGVVYLYCEAIDVSTYLAESFFHKKKSVILTSATLTMKNSFSHFIKRLGLSRNEIITKQFASPFDYDEQVQFLVPNDFPHIVHDHLDEFIYSTCEAIISLSEITKGRILVLFTSYDMLRKAYYLLKETMDTDKYMLIAQGISSGSRARLKKNFQTFSNAILLGTSSFWEGVDIPGEDLSCLFIVRLPFQPPTHPVYEAKANELKANGKNAFFELSLPDAVIRFKQGFGRLIRSQQDRGIVFICDARIVTARYGSFFIDSIPNVSVTYDSTYSLMKRAENWF